MYYEVCRWRANQYLYQQLLLNNRTKDILFIIQLHLETTLRTHLAILTWLDTNFPLYEIEGLLVLAYLETFPSLLPLFQILSLWAPI